MTPDQAEQWLFADTLGCELSLPCRLVAAGPAVADGAEMRLRAVGLVEDGRTEDNEDRQEKGVALQRMEAKLDLLLALCGQLLRDRQPGMPTLPVRFSSRGIVMPLPAVDLPTGAQPLALQFQAAEWLPDLVCLPVRLLARSDRLYLAFDGLSPVLQDLLDRHVFRLHRRHVAQQRQLQR